MNYCVVWIVCKAKAGKKMLIGSRCNTKCFGLWSKNKSMAVTNLQCCAQAAPATAWMPKPRPLVPGLPVASHTGRVQAQSVTSHTRTAVGAANHQSLPTTNPRRPVAPRLLPQVNPMCNAGDGPWRTPPTPPPTSNPQLASLWTF
jgi:hypothetical protein